MAKQEVGLKIDVDVKSVGEMKNELRAATKELKDISEKFGKTSEQAIEASKKVNKLKESIADTKAVADNLDLKKQLKAATFELNVLTDKFGSTSKEAIAAAQKVAGLKDAIGDAKALADTFNPDKKFVALGGAVQGAVAGFSALQGAMGLFGSESKDVEKLLLKVQSAMALQQGISGVAGAMDSMKLLAGTIKTQVVTAFSTLRGAIIATGLGALAVAAGLVIANFDSFKKAIFNLIPGLKGITDFVGGLITKFTDFVGITSEAERNLEKLIKTNNRANQTIDDQIKLLEAQGGKEDQIYNLKKQRGENELNNLRQNLKVKGKLTEDELKQFRDLKNDQQVLDIQEINRKKKLAEDEAKRVQDENEKKKQSQAKINADNEKLRQETEAKKLAADKVLDDARRINLTERQKEEEDAISKFEESKKVLLAAGVTDLSAIEEQKEMELAAIRKKYADRQAQKIQENAQRTKELQTAAITDEKERTAAENELKLQGELDEETKRFKAGELRLEQYLINLALIRQKYANDKKAKEDAENLENLRKIKEINDAQVAAEVALQNAKFEAASAGLNALATLAGGNEKIANLFIAIDRALAIAKIIIDTQREIAGYYATGAASPMNLIVPGSGMALATKQALIAKIRAGASIATIAATTIAKFRSGGGASVGGGGGGGNISTTPPMTPQLAPQVQATQVNTAAVNQMGNRAARAYVLNSDIQNEEQRNAYINRNASIGNP